MEDVFKSFCSFGARGAPPLMDGSKWAKFCRDSKLITSKFSSVDVDMIFTRVKGKERKIDFATFQKALELVAEKKGVDVSALENKILGSGGPSSSGTQAIDTGITAKLTDASTYQATHAQRFDADGKGKGLAGRDHPSGPTAIGGEAGSGTISSYKA